MISLFAGYSEDLYSSSYPPAHDAISTALATLQTTDIRVGCAMAVRSARKLFQKHFLV